MAAQIAIDSTQRAIRLAPPHTTRATPVLTFEDVHYSCGSARRCAEHSSPCRPGCASPRARPSRRRPRPAAAPGNSHISKSPVVSLSCIHLFTTCRASAPTRTDRRVIGDDAHFFPRWANPYSVTEITCAHTPGRPDSNQKANRFPPRCGPIWRLSRHYLFPPGCSILARNARDDDTTRHQPMTP